MDPGQDVFVMCEIAVFDTELVSVVEVTREAVIGHGWEASSLPEGSGGIADTRCLRAWAGYYARANSWGTSCVVQKPTLGGTDVYY